MSRVIRFRLGLALLGLSSTMSVAADAGATKEVTVVPNVKALELSESLGIPDVKFNFKIVGKSDSKQSPLNCSAFRLEKSKPFATPESGGDEFTYVYGGEMIVTAGSNVSRVKEGDAIFIAKGTKNVSVGTDSTAVGVSCYNY
jgi:uncharacterized cupin superfamily protein